MGLILITHDLRVAFSVCDRIYVLYAGSLLEVGAARATGGASRCHPYTLGLLLSEPPPTGGWRELVAIPGSVPDRGRGRRRVRVRAALPLGGGGVP